MSIETLSNSTEYPNIGIGVRVLQAMLHTHPKNLKSSNIYVKISHGQQTWKSPPSSRPGPKPRWNSYKLFQPSDSQIFQISLFTKAFIFQDANIGNCKISISQFKGHQTEWWGILNQKQELIGSILLTFDLPQQGAVPTLHSSQNSGEFKQDYFKQLSQLEPEQGELHLKWRSCKTPVHQRSREGLSLFQKELAFENCRLREKQTCIKALFEQAKLEGARIKKSKAEINRYWDTLRRREKELKKEQEELILEQKMLKKEKEEIRSEKAQLNHDYAKLKQEKYRVMNEKRKIDQTTKMVGEASKCLVNANLKRSKGNLTEIDWNVFGFSDNKHEFM